ncbi:nucleotidyl transferase AbiEii/AbiGii toxin family protein [Candidatus Nitrososphaera gargensis]|uniref:nucleotidyl transferase AbiEii/AbiGii toxin family protein n=1 Tax=Candidatus Nitrososphaera gargensis TaxID=497727 RepID=UPI000A87DDFF|nr:nucleotidyl transferase AbiEii/AbiGii toxin family protein [Candidatus Nitrososphaera gargensis]
MIDAERIRRLAREEKIGAAVVEKDYALTWLLSGFFLKDSQLKDSFVLKGGTAIRKAFFPGKWRFSEDLDFTVVDRNDANSMSLYRKSWTCFLQRAALPIPYTHTMLTPEQ